MDGGATRGSVWHDLAPRRGLRALATGLAPRRAADICARRSPLRPPAPPAQTQHDLVFDLPLEAKRAKSFLADARYGQLTLSLDQLGVQLDAAASQPRLEKVLARYERQKNLSLFFMQVMCLIGMLPMMTISITVRARCNPAALPPCLAARLRPALQRSTLSLARTPCAAPSARACPPCARTRSSAASESRRACGCGRSTKGTQSVTSAGTPRHAPSRCSPSRSACR